MLWGVVSRMLAGGLGGYLLAQVLSVALVAPWGLPRADAVLVAMLLSIGIYAIALMAAFAASNAKRAWMILALALLASAGLAWVAL